MVDPNLLISSELDQIHAACLDQYDDLSPIQRGAIAKWLIGDNGPLHESPDDVLNTIASFAIAGFVETARRWGQRQDQ